MSASIDRQIDLKSVSHQTEINRALRRLGESPRRGRIEQARDIVLSILPEGFVWEFVQGPVGPIEIEIIGYDPPEVNGKFEL